MNLNVGSRRFKSILREVQKTEISGKPLLVELGLKAQNYFTVKSVKKTGFSNAFQVKSSFEIDFILQTNKGYKKQERRKFELKT